MTRTMPRSQNARFYGPESESVEDWIRGETIARRLAVGLGRDGWHFGEIDCWRDAGYSFATKRGDEELEFVVIPYRGRTDGWILQIAPVRLPGFLRRWFGAVRSASPDCLYRVAIQTQMLLTDMGFHDFRWCWDDLADRDDCPAEPPPP